MKKALSIILSLIFAFSAFSVGAVGTVGAVGDSAAYTASGLAAARSYLPPFASLAGDADANGKLNARDVILIMQSMVGVSVGRFRRSAADVNADGAVNAKDVEALMRALTAWTKLGETAARPSVCDSRDAFILVDDAGYGDAESGITPGWALDARGASAREALSGEYGLMKDISTTSGTALIREFNTIAAGRLELSTSVTVRGDGFSLEYRNDAGEAIYRLYTEGAWRVAAPGGAGTALTASIDPDAKYDISVVVDLDAGIARTAIDGGEYSETALLVSGTDANAREFRFATDAAHTPTALPGAIRIVANYAANDDFMNMRRAEFSRKWTGGATLKSGVLALGRGEAERSFDAVSGTVIAETQFILPRGEEFSLGIAHGDGAAVTFSAKDGSFFANGKKVYDGFAVNLRYRLRIEADTVSSRAIIKLNGRKVGEVPFARGCASIDRLFIANASDSEMRLDSAAVYEKLAHGDYVPAPKAPSGGEDSLVGVFSDDMSLGDLVEASAQPDFEPLLGYYDRSSSEAADWEIKYLVEHGVDFEAFPLVTVRENGTVKPNVSDRLFGAYMNAEYSDFLKYCVVWDSENGKLPENEQEFLDLYLPFFVENFFKDERYLTIEDMPVVMISDVEWFVHYVGGAASATNIICDLEDAAIDLGFDGVLVIGASAAKNEYENVGIAGCAPYTWGKSGADADVTRSLIRKSASSRIYSIPTVGVGENGAALGSRTALIAPEKYRSLNEWVRDSYLPGAASEEWQEGLVMLSNWNDFGAGSYVMPCERHCGFAYLDTLREVYTGEKANASLNAVPSAVQKARICHALPQDKHTLAALGSVGAPDSGRLHVNGYTAKLSLPCETAENGELLVPYETGAGLDALLRARSAWDAQSGVLELSFQGHDVSFTVGAQKFAVDGNEYPLGFTLYALDGVPMIPIARLCAAVRYACEVRGAEAFVTSADDVYYSAFDVTPAVFAVGKEYQIMFFEPSEAYAWIEIDGAEYNDAVCGNMKSNPGIRRVCVPQEALDAAKHYTVCEQKIVGGRQPYNTKTGALTRREYRFNPVPTDRAPRAYMIGDAHGDILAPTKAALAFGDLDFLILNGDITDDCSEIGDFANVYELAASITCGSKPIVYARGNHENRGAAAELLPEYTPTRGGQTYYTFRLGSIWGIVLDFGEDKDDGDAEFGGSARHAQFRRRETEYLREVIANAAAEYAEEGVEHRIAVVHVPFPYDLGDKYNVDTSLFTEWRDMIADTGAELMLSCHMHYYRFTMPGNPDFLIDPPCPVSVGSWRTDEYLGGTGYIFDDGKIYVRYTSVDGEVLREETAQ